MIKKLRIIWLILFISAISFSMWTVTYCLQYDVLTIHDLAFPFGRNFLEPDHGRYLAYFTSNLLVEKLPEIFNIHPNDFSPKFISVIKGLIVILSCLIITNAAFLFTEERKKNIFKIPILNPIFTITYILVFLALFNDNFFFNGGIGLNYYAVFENIIFFEYPSSIVLYTAVMSILGYFFINDKIPDKTTFNIFIVLLFLLGITVETVNFPVFVGLLLLLPYFLFNKEKFKNNKKNIILIYTVYFIALFAYYIRPNGHVPIYHGTFFHYLQTALIPFIKYYCKEIIMYNSRIVLLTIILFVPALYIDKEKAKKLMYFVTANIAGFLFFYAIMFFAGYIYLDSFFIEPKWTDIYRVVTLFYLIITIGFIIDFKTKKYSNMIKFLTCILVFLIFHKNLITEYYTNLEFTISKGKEIRTAAYILEKIALASDKSNPELIIPSSFNKYGDLFWYNDYECGYPIYLKNVYPKINKNKIILSEDDNILNNLSFDENELEQLKFSHLLKERMYRHKKVFNNCK